MSHHLGWFALGGVVVLVPVVWLVSGIFARRANARALGEFWKFVYEEARESVFDGHVSKCARDLAFQADRHRRGKDKPGALDKAYRQFLQSVFRAPVRIKAQAQRKMEFMALLRDQQDRLASGRK